MTYASATSMTNRFGQDELFALADPDDSGTVNQTVLGQALEDADAVINGYLASKYALPLTTVPPMLEILACDIARYRLASVINVTEQIKDRYDQAITYLEKVARGTISLGVDSTGEQAVQTGGPEGENRIFAAGRGRVFDGRDLADYDYRGPFSATGRQWP